MAFKSYLEHTEPILKKLGILNIFQINDSLTGMFMFQYYHLENLPEVLENYFVTNNQNHQHNMRNASKLHKASKQTFQLSRFGCETHGLSARLTV